MDRLILKKKRIYESISGSGICLYLNMSNRSRKVLDFFLKKTRNLGEKSQSCYRDCQSCYRHAGNTTDSNTTDKKCKIFF